MEVKQAVIDAVLAHLAHLEELAQPHPLAPEIRQALDDVLKIYGLTGQMAEVLHQQRDQIQAFGDAMRRFHELLVQHDQQSTAERAEIHGLMIQLRELARKQVAQLDNLERSAGMTQAARAALRDVRPEEATLPMGNAE